MRVGRCKLAMFLARIKLCIVEKVQWHTQADLCLKVLFGQLIEDLSYCLVIGELLFRESDKLGCYVCKDEGHLVEDKLRKSERKTA